MYCEISAITSKYFGLAISRLCLKKKSDKNDYCLMCFACFHNVLRGFSGLRQHVYMRRDVRYSQETID